MNQLVSLLIDAKRPEAAMGAVQTALKTTVAGVDATPLKLLLAQVYLTQQRNADALGIYDALIEVNKEDFRPILAKSLVFKQMGNLTEAQHVGVARRTNSLTEPDEHQQRAFQHEAIHMG